MIISSMAVKSRPSTFSWAFVAPPKKLFRNAKMSFASMARMQEPRSGLRRTMFKQLGIGR
jgi:hypothetical protein